MKTSILFLVVLIPCSQLFAQIIFPVSPKMEVETSTKGQTAILGYSGPLGPIVPPPTDPKSIGVKGVGYTGVVGEARADGGFGVHGMSNRFAGRGIYGECTGLAGYGVMGFANQTGGWGVYGRASDNGEWGGYFSGGKGLLARPRLGVENFNPQYPIHVGTHSGNGNGAHVTEGGSWVNGSSRSFKEKFEQIDVDAVLLKLVSLNISKWQYQGSEEGQHMGPMAEDFYALFGLGHDEKYISTTDGTGVALAAIQALYHRLEEMEQRNQHLSKACQKLMIQLDYLGNEED